VNQIGYFRFFVLMLIAAAVASLPFLLWQLRDVIVLAFGAILLATLLWLVAEPFQRWTGSNAAALVISGLVIIGVLGAMGWIFGSQIGSQLSDVMSRVEQAQGQIRTTLQGTDFGRFLLSHISEGSTSIASIVSQFFKVGVSVIAGALVLVFSAIYLAAQPQLYRYGVVLLFPQHLHGQTRTTLDDVARALRLWLIGQLIQMAIIGMLSFIAVWLIGLPSPVALGFIAAVTEFVPYIGPVIAAIPAILVAFTQSPMTALWTVLAYIVIHQLEGHLVTPLLQRWFVTIPPALMLLGIATIALVFGPVGIIFAGPMVAVAFVLVKKLWVRDTMHERTEMPGR